MLPSCETDTYQKNTQAAYFATRILDTPFWGLYNLLPIILFKNLGATPYQLGFIIALKPIVSLLSSYWATRAQIESSRLLSNISWGRFLAYVPFLFFPLMTSVWYFIFCIGIYMFFQVGMVPAWMELLKQNLPRQKRDKLISYTQIFGYLGGGIFPFLLGSILDGWSESWRWMFPIAALIGLCSYPWQRKIPLKNLELNQPVTHPHILLHPWKNSWDLLKRRPDFANFQIGFLLFGSGLMIIQPVLPIFFVEKLHLSYTEIGVAIGLCKGIGFVCSSSYWTKLIQKDDLFSILTIVSMLTIGFLFCLMVAPFQIVWLYAAYILYGLMQSGSELSWNLSGPIFAKDENSAPYSTVNVISIGIRGIFIPFIGAYLVQKFGFFPVIILSCILCLLSSTYTSLIRRKIIPASS